MPWSKGKLRPLTVYVARGLTRAQALQKAKRQVRGMGIGKLDFRGFSYDPATGKATFV